MKKVLTVAVVEKKQLLNSAPEIYKHVAPTAVNIDPFHVRGCGICKQIVTGSLEE